MFFVDSKNDLALDNYGFPDIAVANDILVQVDDPGESRNDLEKSWREWNHFLPFDAPVSEAVLKIYKNKLAKMNKDKSAAAYQRLERKIKLIQERASRYRIANFSESP